MRKMNKKVGPVKQVPFFAPVMDAKRAMLSRIRTRAGKYGFANADVRPHRLLLYAILQNNKSNLVWRTNIENGSHPAEIRLEKSDAFYVSKIGLAVHKVLILNGEEAPANTPLIHYPDANWFPAADEARDLEGLYSSQLSFKTDQDVRLELFHTSQLRCVPEQQFQPSAADPLTFQYNNEPMLDVAANWGLWGNKRNELELRYGKGVFGAIAGDPANGATPYQNYAVIVLDGFLIVRGAEAVTKSDANLLFAGL